MRKTLIVPLALVLWIGACSTQESESQDKETTTTASQTTTMPDEALPTTTVADDAPGPPDGGFDEETGVLIRRPPGTSGIGDISVVSEPAGNGTRPLLEWQPVEDAILYSVEVYAPDGGGYWAWEGVETSVHVGGEPQLVETAAGPSIVPNMTWSVLAIDADGTIVAVSPRTSISP